MNTLLYDSLSNIPQISKDSIRSPSATSSCSTAVSSLVSADNHLGINYTEHQQALSAVSKYFSWQTAWDSFRSTWQQPLYFTMSERLYSTSQAEKNEAIYRESISKLRRSDMALYLQAALQWTPEECLKLAAMVYHFFGDCPADPLRIVSTVKRVEKDNPGNTRDQLMESTLKKHLRHNIRSSLENQDRAPVFYSLTKPHYVLLEYLLVQYGHLLSLPQQQTDAAIRLRGELAALENDITGLKAELSGPDAPKGGSVTHRYLNALLSATEALYAHRDSPEDPVRRAELDERNGQLLEVRRRMLKWSQPVKTLQDIHNVPRPVRSGANSHTATLLPVSGAITTTASALGGISYLTQRHPGVTSVAGLLTVAGACWAYKVLARIMSPSSPPAVAELLPAGPVAQIERLKTLLETMVGELTTDDGGHLKLLSLGGELAELHQRLHDSVEFQAQAMELLARNGLQEAVLGAAETLRREMPNARTTATKHLRRKRDDTAATLALVLPPELEPLLMLILKALITPETNEAASNREKYFSAWRDALPPGAEVAWLRNACRDEQNAYKLLLDDVTSRGVAFGAAVKQNLERQSGWQAMSQALTSLDLPWKAEYIVIRANVTDRLGSRSSTQPVSNTLAQAWQTGELATLLDSAELTVEILPERRMLDSIALTAFRRLLKSLPSLPDVSTLMEDNAVVTAFRQLTDARFTLKTLEAGLKGELRDNDHIRGLDIVNAFRAGAAEVVSGQLTLTARDASGQLFTVPLSGWLLLRHRGEGCVLYDADAGERSHYFNTEQALMQFVSKEAMQDLIVAERLKEAAMAERMPGAARLAGFFHALHENPANWYARGAKLHFTPGEATTFDGALQAFAGGLLARNTQWLSYDAATGAAATRAVRLQDNWIRLRGDKVPSLLDYTRSWILRQPMYGKFLQDMGVYDRAVDFDPDRIVIKSGHGAGTVTEYAAYLRRHEDGGGFGNEERFASQMEVLPREVAKNDYLNVLTPKEKQAFIHELSRAVSSRAGNVTTNTADGRYIATLERPEQLSLHTALKTYIKLNEKNVREGLDAALISGYPGSSYQAELGVLLDFTVPENRVLRDGYNLAEVGNMLLALAIAENDAKLPGSYQPLPRHYAVRLRALLEQYPASSVSKKGEDVLAPLSVGDVRVPGMIMLSLVDNLSKTGTELRATQYVYSPDPIYGQHFFQAETFNELLLRAGPARAVVESRVRLIDRGRIAESFRGAATGDTRVSYAAVNAYNGYNEMIETLMSNADEKTISRWEVIRDATVSGASLALLPFCLASGPFAVLGCAAATGITLADDMRSAADLWKRGSPGTAALIATWGLLDVSDVTAGLKAGARAVPRAGAYITKHVPEVMRGVAGGVVELLRKSGVPALFWPSDVQQAIRLANHGKSAFEAGWLKRELAINVDVSKAKREKPRQQLAGEYLELNGKWYVQEQGYHGERPLVYEIYSDDGWRSVRVRNPSEPGVQGEKVVWCGKWVKDTSGLKGGGRESNLAYFSREFGFSEAQYSNLEGQLAQMRMGRDTNWAGEYINQFINAPLNLAPEQTKILKQEIKKVIISSHFPDLTVNEHARLSDILQRRAVMAGSGHHQGDNSSWSRIIAFNKSAAQAENSRATLSDSILRVIFNMDEKTSSTLLFKINEKIKDGGFKWLFSTEDVVVKYAENRLKPEHMRSFLDLKSKSILKSYYNFTDTASDKLCHDLAADPLFIKGFIHVEYALDDVLKKGTKSNYWVNFLKLKNEVALRVVFNLDKDLIECFKEKVEGVIRKDLKKDQAYPISSEFLAFHIDNLHKNKPAELKLHIDSVVKKNVDEMLSDYTYGHFSIKGLKQHEIESFQKYWDYQELPDAFKTEPRKYFTNKSLDIDMPAASAVKGRLWRNSRHQYKNEINTSQEDWIRKASRNANYNLPKTSTNTDFIIKKLFENDTNGIILGEVHDKTAGKKMLINNIERFTSEGVDRIYIEGFTTEYLKHDFDRFNNHNEISHRLMNYIINIDEGYKISKTKFNIMDVFTTIQKNNSDGEKSKIKLVMIESEGVKPDYLLNDEFRKKYHRDFTDEDGIRLRSEVANYIMYKKVVDDQKNSPGKFVILVGMAHANSYQRNGRSIYGLGPALNVPTIDCISDINQSGEIFKRPDPADNKYGLFSLKYYTSM